MPSISKGVELLYYSCTVLGTGRLIFQILFEWVYQGHNIPVIGSGQNIYQFVHADDLVSACIAAGDVQRRYL